MIQKQLINALIGILVLIGVMLVLGLVFEDEMVAVTSWVVERLGFWGLAAILLVTDTLVTPFPPDILLAVIAKSPLAENWPVYVGILGLVSVVAGLSGYWIGRWLGHFRWCQRLFGEFKEDHRQFIGKYGFWGVGIGAITPLPYSVTCWSAGVLGIRWTKVLAATLLFRVPRFYAFYWLLATTGSFFTSG
ncbi:MAG: YqaA family protein [Wenzhouxiangella sp.]